jgi:esterase/lipase
MKTFLFFLIILISFNKAYNQTNEINKKKNIIVIVHGAWGGSWAFKKVDSLLTSKGLIVYRPCLTGQGERFHLSSSDINLSTHVKDVVNMILYEDIYNVVIVGHSYGGMVVTGVADSIPERIRKIIYLDAFIPDSGKSVLDIVGENDVKWINSLVKDDFMIPKWVPNDKKPPKDVPMSFKTFTEKISLKNKNTAVIPKTYILTVDKGKKPEEDSFYPFAQKAIKQNYKYYEMTADHNPQWSEPEKLADILYNEAK